MQRYARLSLVGGGIFKELIVEKILFSQIGGFTATFARDFLRAKFRKDPLQTDYYAPGCVFIAQGDHENKTDEGG